jgi:Uma2 family endonuclease
VTVGQYHAMTNNGILGPDHPVELLEDVLVRKIPKNPPHRIATRATRQALDAVVPNGRYVDEQEPLTPDTSEPEPDVAVIRGATRDYANRHPGPGDVGLVVEIADAALDRDRIVKKKIYAAAGIPCYWLIDVNRRRLEVYSDPTGFDYVRSATYEEHERVVVLMDGAQAGSVLVSDLLP